jgi:catechol 2,3-dioxygenase-like lactoylglutathione lyase family enzyme
VDRVGPPIHGDSGSTYDGGMRLRPMLQVDDVAASSRWYQDVLGLRSGHGGDEFEMLFAGEEFVLQLHRLDADEHGILQPQAGAARGAGVSMWFEAEDRPAFEALFARAEAAGATILEPPHWNPLAHHHESAVVDADGYVVVIHSPFEMAS